MKRYIGLTLVFIVALTTFAQHQMQVWQDGMPTSFIVAEVDSITFSENATIFPKELLLGKWRNINLGTRRDLCFFDNDTAIYSERPYGGTVPETVLDYGPWKYSVLEGSIVFLYEPVYPFNLTKDTFQYSTPYNIIDSILTLSTFSKDGEQFVYDIEFIKEQ